MSTSSSSRYDCLVGDEFDSPARRDVKRHQLFEDNFSVSSDASLSQVGPAFRYFADRGESQPSSSSSSSWSSSSSSSSVFDALLHLAANLFHVPDFTLQVMMSVGLLVRNSFDHLVDYAIASKLSQTLCSQRLAYLCKLTEGSRKYFFWFGVGLSLSAIPYFPCIRILGMSP